MFNTKIPKGSFLRIFLSSSSDQEDITLKYETPRPTPAVQAPNAAGRYIPGKNPGCGKSCQNNTHKVTLC